MTKNHKGFSVLVLVLIVAIIGVIGAIGYKLVKNNTNNSQPKVTNNSTDNNVTKPLEQLPSDRVEMKEYKNTEFGFSFQYPSNWKYDADFGYIERGANEGSVSVTSPSGATVTFAANLGGKGGGCGDPNPNDRPHHTALCNTLEILNITQTQPAGSKEYLINLYQYRYTASGDDAKSEYGMYVDSGKYAPTIKGATIGAVFPYSIMENMKGNIESHTSGGDRTSSQYFSSQQAKDTEMVLKTFKLL